MKSGWVTSNTYVHSLLNGIWFAPKGQTMSKENYGVLNSSKNE